MQRYACHNINEAIIMTGCQYSDLRRMIDSERGRNQGKARIDEVVTRCHPL